MLPYTISTTLLLLLVATHTASSSVHYDDFCDNASNSVVFTSFKTNQCVCFNAGTYQHHAHSTPCTPTLFRMEYEQCVEMPSGTMAITRVEHKTGNPMTTIAFKQCSLGVHSRVKRDEGGEAPSEDATTAAPAAGGAPSGNGSSSAGGSEDEDFSSNGTEIGHEYMRTQLKVYFEGVIAKLTGLPEDGGASSRAGLGHKYPVIKLLDYTKFIMQKTCTLLNPDFFEFALNSFINLQLDQFHVKEPYISYSAFVRIEQALKRCLADANPHIFVNDEYNSTDRKSICDNHTPNKTGEAVVLNSGTKSEEIIQVILPAYGKSELDGEPGKIFEPLIETSWKMFLSTHSYCYSYFSEYFNDHHTFSVVMLPLFSNEVQDVWFNEGNGTKGYDVSDPIKTKLYGGLLGDVLKLMKNVDSCTGASRAISAYPWYMNRPLRDTSNDWVGRRKREATGYAEVVDEVEMVYGKVVMEESVLVHECKNSVPIKEKCRGV